MRDVGTLTGRAIRSLLLIISIVGPWLTAGGARAGSWERTFEPAAIGALAMPGRTRATVVAAGAPSAALEEARAALVAGLKASGRWTAIDVDLVRDLDPDFSDARVVGSERDARNVESIWVLRLMPSEGRATAIAGVKIYTPLGVLLRVFYASKGEPLRVDVTTTEPAAEYLRQRISPMSRGSGQIDTSPADPGTEVFARGGSFAKDGRRLAQPRDLYIAMGRYDLVRQYDDVDADKSLATIISGGVVFVGVVLFGQDLFNNGGTPQLELGALGISGIAAVGLGTVGLVLARTIEPDPLDWGGKVKAASAYNADLGRRLVLQSVGIAPLSDGLALSVGGAF